MRIARAAARNAHSGLPTPRRVRRNAVHTQGAYANAISPDGQDPASQKSVKPENGSATATTAAAHGAASYSRESRYVPSASRTMTVALTRYVDSARSGPHDTATQIRTLSGL